MITNLESSESIWSDGKVDRKEFALYLKWAGHHYPDVTDAEELVSVVKNTACIRTKMTIVIASNFNILKYGQDDIPCFCFFRLKKVSQTNGSLEQLNYKCYVFTFFLSPSLPTPPNKTTLNGKIMQSLKAIRFLLKNLVFGKIVSFKLSRPKVNLFRLKTKAK